MGSVFLRFYSDKDAAHRTVRCGAKTRKSGGSCVQFAERIAGQNRSSRGSHGSSLPRSMRKHSNLRWEGGSGGNAAVHLGCAVLRKLSHLFPVQGWEIGERSVCCAVRRRGSPADPHCPSDPGADPAESE